MPTMDGLPDGNHDARVALRTLIVRGHLSRRGILRDDQVPRRLRAFIGYLYAVLFVVVAFDVRGDVCRANRANEMFGVRLRR